MRDAHGRLTGTAGSPGAIELFDREAERYDAWFDSSWGQELFAAEADALRLLMADLRGPALEVGVGTGRFAQALGVPYGVDPAWGTLRLARRRGVRVAQARGEALPFCDRAFRAVALIVTLCFADPLPVLREARRVLTSGGALIVGEIIKDSTWGRWYLERKAAGDLFYRHARFYLREELEGLLAAAGFVVAAASSAITQPPGDSPAPEPAHAGIRPGASFVCLLARAA